MYQNLNTPYRDDLPLFQELHLEPFSCKMWDKTFVVKIETEEGWMEINVTCAPAQFFDFKIFCKDSGEVTEITTGSGTLRQYYPFAEQIMQGMIVVKSLTALANNAVEK